MSALAMFPDRRLLQQGFCHLNGYGSTVLYVLSNQSLAFVTSPSIDEEVGLKSAEARNLFPKIYISANIQLRRERARRSSIRQQTDSAGDFWTVQSRAEAGSIAPTSPK